MNLVEIVNQLGTLSRDLDKAVAQLSDLEVTAVDAEATYKTKFARVFRESAGKGLPIKERELLATEECEQEFRHWGIAASTVRVQKESLRALHSRIDVGRTIASTARAEASLASTGVTP